MNKCIFLPYEINCFNSSKTIDNINKIILMNTDQTYLFDTNKMFRGKFNENKIHLWDNILNITKKQHYYLNIIEKNNNVEIKIFSRNNLFYLSIYIIFMLIGFYGLLKMILEMNYFGILFIILWIIGVLIIGNIIFKKARKKTIDYLKEKLL